MAKYRDEWPVYTSIAERKRNAERAGAKIKAPSPVIVEGSRIAKTFWGKSWCENLERYSDYANRLPRGRTYVRSGCVIDLKILPGVVNAAVSGSRVYRTDVKITPVPAARWKAICRDCAGAIDSLVELLEGRFSKPAMERLCQEGTGMFPLPAEIQFSCTCPDSARMCKHVAAVLYGIGARLDENPELLFTLRKVNQEELITNAGQHLTKPKTDRMLEGENLSELFGIDIAEAGKRRRKKQP
jgi:uncharacterized Zn finger protein